MWAPHYEPLGLRRWAHMLGFRGHFLTKSRRYSLTFTDLRHRRRSWRLLDDLAHHHITDNAADTVIVINDWRVTAIGHRNDTERDLAAAVAERKHRYRRTSAVGGTGSAFRR